MAWGTGLAADLPRPKVPSPSKPAATAKPDRGFYYIHDEVKDVPWSIHIIKIDRKRKELELETVTGEGTTLGMGIVSEMVKSLPPSWGKPVAAINGDFFRWKAAQGDPDGLQIIHGELISGPNPERVCMWVDRDGNPHRYQVTPQFTVIWPNKATTPVGLNEPRGDEAVIYTRAIGTSSPARGGLDVVLENSGSGPWLPLKPGQKYAARVRQVKPAGNTPLDTNVMVLSLGGDAPHPPKIEPGMLLQVSTATAPDISGARTGIGGGPTLVGGGKVGEISTYRGRNPRSAVGWNKDFIFFVEVDGRQRSLSVGMTLTELAAYMLKLGCDEAINLDGGGSATLWVMGNVINSPSEGGERPNANALVLLQKDKAP